MPISALSRNFGVPNMQPAHVTKSSPYADHRTPLIENSWYVAGMSSELEDGAVVARTLLGRKLALYRTQSGVAVALADRCLHRSFPLSKGFRQGENLVCGYHGMKYGPDGRCAALPAEGHAAPQLGIPSYRLVERAPLLWIWMGDRDAADEAGIPDHGWLSDAGWTPVSGYFNIPSNYVGMQENLMDLTHFSYLHADTVGTPGYATAPYEMVVGDGTVKVLRELRNSPPPPVYGVPMKLMGRDVDRYTDANFVLPGAHLAYARIVNTQAEPDEIETHRVNLLHAITPERQDSLHYWWFLSRDFAQDDQTATDYLIASVNKAFNEDVEALTAIADQHRDGVDFQEMSFATDRPGLAMRKIVAGLADREAAAKDPQAS